MHTIIKRNKQEIIIGVIFVLCAFGFNVYRVQGDGIFYYSFLENLLHLPNPEILSSRYEMVTFQQSGCAYFNLPFYLIAYFIEKLFNFEFNFRGITLRAISINIASNFYMLISLFLTIRILRNLNLKKTIIPITSIFFSTSAFVVTVCMPSYNHAVDIFINTCFVYLFLENEKRHPVESFWLGIVYVLSILVRYFNFILIVPVIAYYLYQKEYQKIKYLLIGFIGFAWIMPLIFYIYNGNVLAPFVALKTCVAQNKPPYLFLLPKNFFKYLVHPLHGLFVWSPVVILSALGLLILPKEKQKLGYLFLGMWFSLVFVYGFSRDWHGGWSFSNRYLVGLFPIYVIGVAAFLEKHKIKGAILAILATLYSIFLFFNWYICIIQGQMGTPFNMLEAWIKGKSESFYGKGVNFNIFLKRIVELCRYKYLFRLIK